MKSVRLFALLCLLIQLCLHASAFAAVDVTVRPARAALSLTEAQQFTATGVNTTNRVVGWAVDGIVGGNSTVGTFCSSGFSRPPAKRSTRRITARRVVQSTPAGSATV